MIREEELQEAIDQCISTKNPTANTCLKLASFLIIKQHLFGKDDGYSSSNGIKSDFMQAVDGAALGDILPVIDDLMTKLQLVNPKLYEDTMKKIRR